MPARRENEDEGPSEPEIEEKERIKVVKPTHTIHRWLMETDEEYKYLPEKEKKEVAITHFFGREYRLMERLAEMRRDHKDKREGLNDFPTWEHKNKNKLHDIYMHFRMWHYCNIEDFSYNRWRSIDKVREKYMDK